MSNLKKALIFLASCCLVVSDLWIVLDAAPSLAPGLEGLIESYYGVAWIAILCFGVLAIGSALGSPRGLFAVVWVALFHAAWCCWLAVIDPRTFFGGAALPAASCLLWVVNTILVGLIAVATLAWRRHTQSASVEEPR